MKVLLVDDEPTIRATLGDALEDAGHETDTVDAIAAGRVAIEAARYDCLITDLRLPDGSGLDLLALARKKQPEIAMLVITAHQTIDTAIEATKLGADYLVKPFLNEEVLARLGKMEEVRDLREEVKRLKTEATGRTGIGRMIGESKAMRELFGAIETIGPTDTTVLITGESGTGKELIAQAIHGLSPRDARKMVKLSCAALPETLLEDELFGHERGAFTDAKERKIGRFEMASGSTIFLDDIDDMSLATQVKLLRVLQEREFERIGGTRTVEVDVRVVVATKVDLSLLVRQGRFRDDLFFRLNVVELRAPPLRDRLDDLPLLVRHFCSLHGSGREYEVDESSLDAMRKYAWPGNIRELEHAVMRAIAMAGKSDRLERRFLLQMPAAMSQPDAAAFASPAGGTLLSTGFPQPMDGAPFPDEGGLPPSVDPSEIAPLRQVVMEAERDYIGKILAYTGGSRTRTAQLLGISRKNLWEKMKELGLK